MAHKLSGPVTVLGGLPLWAECSFTRDYWGEDDCSVDALYWMKRDGTKGKEVSQKIMDRLEKDPCWESDVCLLVSEQAAYEAYKAMEPAPVEFTPC